MLVLITTLLFSLYSSWIGLLAGAFLSTFLLLQRLTSNSIVVEQRASSLLVTPRSMHTEQQVEELSIALLSSDLPSVTVCLSRVDRVGAGVGKTLARADNHLRGRGGSLSVHVNCQRTANVVRELAPFVSISEETFECCDRNPLQCDNPPKSDILHQPSGQLGGDSSISRL